MRRRAVLILATVAIGALGCSSGPPAPSVGSEPPTRRPAVESIGVTSPPSVAPEPALASFAPEAAWRPVLELSSGTGGTDRGSFRASGRYRIRFDCLGAGSIAIKAGGEQRAALDCTSAADPGPTLVRRARGTQEVMVVPRGEVQWIALFEVPEG